MVLKYAHLIYNLIPLKNAFLSQLIDIQVINALKIRIVSLFSVQSEYVLEFQKQAFVSIIMSVILVYTVKTQFVQDFKLWVVIVMRRIFVNMVVTVSKTVV